MIRNHNIALAAALLAATITLSTTSPSTAGTVRSLLIAEDGTYLQRAKNKLIYKFKTRRAAAQRTGGTCKWHGKLRVLKRYSAVHRDWCN